MLKPQALNYTPKAIAGLRAHPCPGAPLTMIATRWVADLLEQAEVFVLPNLGQLIDRDKPKPEVAGMIFKPPFRVVALEYSATDGLRDGDIYTEVPCSKRISLAWDWDRTQLPPMFRDARDFDHIEPGVAILSLFYIDSAKIWTCTAAAAHLPYDGEWLSRADIEPSGFVDAMIKRGALRKGLSARGYETGLIPLMIEGLNVAEKTLGSREAAIDNVRADLNDEINAYTDLCYALACKNVATERQPAPKALNLCRKGRKPLLKDFHILNLSAVDGGGHALGVTDRTAPRSHLRRGHIRRLGADRITWVNQTMVHGRGGFVEKAYAIGAAR